MFRLVYKSIGRSLIVAFVLAFLFSSVAVAGKPVAIKTPVAGEVVSGLYGITGTGGGADTEVSIGGGAWQPTSGGKSWSLDWDTTAYVDGPVTIEARYAGDASGDSITVTVNNGGGSTARPPALGEVVINEFVAASATEWVELYNTTSEALDISGMWIDDLVDAGGAPKMIPVDTTIPAEGYYVMTFASYLNNTGDDVRFLDGDGTTVFDTYTYSTAPPR